MDIYLPEYTATDYSEEYTKLVEATSPNKVAALTEVGYIPDIHLLEKSHTPWAYYMTWSEEFCIGENSISTKILRLCMTANMLLPESKWVSLLYVTAVMLTL